MTSDRRIVSSSWRWSGIALVFASIGCASSSPRFALRSPVLDDPDRTPFSVACRIDDEKQRVCAPETYVSPLAWDGIDNSIFRPFAEVWKVSPAGRALNVNALDEVPDSSWFTNRPSPLTSDLLRGACSDDLLLHPERDAPGSWVIDKGKADGSTPGFRVKINGKKFMLKVDPDESTSAASVIGAALHHAVGYNTSCEQVVEVDPKLLRLEPGLTMKDNSGIEQPFDQKLLDKMLSSTRKKGTRLRLLASAWLPGHLLGPFSYQGTRDDDYNDVIPHEDRRELRGARVLEAWIDHFDSREQNSMDSWIAADPENEQSSPGYVRHYFLDFSDSLGSEWPWDGISRRLGHSYLLDYGDIGTDFVTLGIPLRRWDRVERTPGFEMFSYFHHEDFEPDQWKNEYPNSAFSSAQEGDNAWMTRILSKFSVEDLRKFVELARFERPVDEAYLVDLLDRRLARVLDRYLSKISPLTDVKVTEENLLCATDLQRKRKLRPLQAFRYSARLERGGEPAAAPSFRVEGDRVCARLTHGVVSSGEPADAPARYMVLSLANGAAQYPLRVHLYDLGGKNGFRLVGLERLESH